MIQWYPGKYLYFFSCPFCGFAVITDSRSVKKNFFCPNVECMKVSIASVLNVDTNACKMREISINEIGTQCRFETNAAHMILKDPDMLCFSQTNSLKMLVRKGSCWDL